MKFILYAAQHDRGRSVYFSLDMRVDALWWLNAQRELEQCSLWFIAAEVSINQAVHCLQWMQHHAADRHTAYPSNNHHSSTKDWIYQLEQWVCRYTSADQLEQLWCMKRGWTPLGEHIMKQQPNENQLAGHWHHPDWQKQLIRGAASMVDVLRGRSLLLPELQMLLQDVQSPYSVGWSSYLQLAYLEKRIHISNGVERIDFIKEKDSSWLNRIRQTAHTIQFQQLQGKRFHQARCRRCNSSAIHWTPCARCGSPECGYCEECLTMGKSRECSLLLQTIHPTAAYSSSHSLSAQEQLADHSIKAAVIQPHLSSPEQLRQHWGLSSAQSHAAYQALEFLVRPIKMTIDKTAKQFLLWAVTGAGKTEMVFPLIEQAINSSKRVLIATPRRDVVLELAPRIQKAFPQHTLAVLYGGSEDRWQSAEITLSTTHQLLRFYQAFDLVIIDEIDAFPYFNNPMLIHAAEAACAPDGKFILLSATPPLEMQRAIRRQQLEHAKVPVRFHGHPLPVPKLITTAPFSHLLNRKKLPTRLMEQLHISIRRGAQVFLFIPRISWIPDTVALLQKHFPQLPIAGTSSQDEHRAEKVLQFRAKELRILVTTTILERGVTVPGSDVYIVEANHKLFTAAALIQMAGRAGRSKEDPAGRVVFAAAARTTEQKRAVQQIRLMNRIAKKEGYFKNKI